MKKTKRCPKCDSEKIGYLAQIPDFVDEAGTEGVPAAPRALGMVPKQWQEGWVRPATRTQSWPLGELEAYICTSCGFTESYVKEPDQVRFEEIEGFQWVDRC